MSDEAIMGLNLPTGIPFVYELDENLKPIKSMQFLGDEETVKAAMEAVANQGKAKWTLPSTILATSVAVNDPCWKKDKRTPTTPCSVEFFSSKSCIQVRFFPGVHRKIKREETGDVASFFFCFSLLVFVCCDECVNLTLSRKNKTKLSWLFTIYLKWDETKRDGNVSIL